MRREQFLNSNDRLSLQVPSRLCNWGRAESTHAGQELGKLRQQKRKIEIFIE
jgi:hypothetical protein